MSNNQQYPGQKTQDDRYSNQSKQGTNPGREYPKNPNYLDNKDEKLNPNQKQKVAPDASNDPRREEEDRPRAVTK